jgi:hypothetical protein
MKLSPGIPSMKSVRLFLSEKMRGYTMMESSMTIAGMMNRYGFIAFPMLLDLIVLTRSVFFSPEVIQ